MKVIRSTGMLKNVLAGLLIGAFVWGNATYAAENKIAFVDVKSAVENTKAYQKGIKHLERLKAQREKELDALRNKVLQGEKDMLGQSLAMSAERRIQKENELKELRKSFKRKQQDAQEELVSEKNRLDQSVVADFYKVVQKYGKNGHYDLILPKSNMIYSNPELDITSEITKLLDKK